MYVSLMHVFKMHVSMMHVFMMHMSRILDPDACVHDAHMYVACIYDPQSLTLMCIPMILDPDACVQDARMNDAYIHDLYPCTLPRIDSVTGVFQHLPKTQFISIDIGFFHR